MRITRGLARTNFSDYGQSSINALKLVRAINSNTKVATIDINCYNYI